MSEAAKSFQLSILTPEGAVFKGTANHVAAPGLDGLFGVLAGHADLVALLGAGPVAVRQGKSLSLFRVEDGVVEIWDGRMTILTSRAAPEEPGVF